MRKPPWRVSLIEALTMSGAEIEARRLKYEAMSEDEYGALEWPGAGSSDLVPTPSSRLSGSMTHVGVDSEVARVEPAKPIACGRSQFASADYFGIKDGRLITNAEAYIDDGSAAAHEPVSGDVVPTGWRGLMETRVGSLRAEIERDRREIARLLSIVEEAGADTGSGSVTVPPDTSPDGVKAHIEQTIDHLQHHRVTDAKQFGNLKKAVEQAARTTGASDAAIGRIRR